MEIFCEICFEVGTGHGANCQLHLMEEIEKSWKIALSGRGNEREAVLDELMDKWMGPDVELDLREKTIVRTLNDLFYRGKIQTQMGSDDEMKMKYHVLQCAVKNREEELEKEKGKWSKLMEELETELEGLQMRYISLCCKVSDHLNVQPTGMLKILFNLKYQLP
eukprot:Pompholyxophrys_punicea_v1_NODE_208_length_2737_cov_12.191275.p1 type:complete len:164 gc:universal NODE_208_length_2737_cov_12.191275:872-381(-)